MQLKFSIRRVVRVLVGFTVLAQGSREPKAAAVSQVEVFRSGTDGYHTFRIPAMVRATNGVLLAFAEGRKNSADDRGDIDLVLKRSFDGGATWGPLQVIGNDGTNTFGGPTPIVDEMRGKILLLSTHYSASATEALVRRGALKDGRIFIQQSMDCGETWSAPNEITATAKQTNWRHYATGPVHGIQLVRGPHAGRLIAPCDHSTADSALDSALGGHLLLSDDGGEHWRIGASADPGKGIINPNECSAVELVDGRVYVVARDQHGSSGVHRASTYSSDAGATFAAPFTSENALVSPVVQGSVLRCLAIDQGERANLILFSAPGDNSARAKMTIRASFDETKTWPVEKIIYEGPAAYSDLVKLPGGTVGVLFESGAKKPYERIVLTTFGLEFLEIQPKEISPKDR